MLAWVLAATLVLAAIVVGAGLVAITGPPPLTPEQLEAWEERHPLAPPPERRVPPERLRLWLRRGLLLLGAAGVVWGGWVVVLHPHRAYHGVVAAVAAVLWSTLCLELARLRRQGELQLRPDGRGRQEGRRWELLDLYSERLEGEEATGLASSREDLARRARRVFRQEDDLAFLRRVRTGSRSGAYRAAAARVLEDLGTFEPPVDSAT